MHPSVGVARGSSSKSARSRRPEPALETRVEPAARCARPRRPRGSPADRRRRSGDPAPWPRSALHRAPRRATGTRRRRRPPAPRARRRGARGSERSPFDGRRPDRRPRDLIEAFPHVRRSAGVGSGSSVETLRHRLQQVPLALLELLPPERREHEVVCAPDPERRACTAPDDPAPGCPKPLRRPGRARSPSRRRGLIRRSRTAASLTASVIAWKCVVRCGRSNRRRPCTHRSFHRRMVGVLQADRVVGGVHQAREHRERRFRPPRSDPARPPRRSSCGRGRAARKERTHEIP